MEMQLYQTRIVPYTIYKKMEMNGQIHYEAIDNITVEESRRMSCNPVMLWREPGTDNYYLAELPLKSSRGTSIKGYLCYLYDDLNDEEKKLFENRTIEIPLTRKEVTPVYSKKRVKK